MEKTMTPEERIRRAEELYSKRRVQGIRVPSNSVNNTPKSLIQSFKKLILQILICALIYYIFYLIQTTNYTFSPDVLSKTKEVLSTDLNFKNIYEQFIKTNLNNSQEEIIPEEEMIQENSTQEINQIEGIGGGDITYLLDETLASENTQDLKIPEIPLTQMEQDAKTIKEQYSMIKPVNDYYVSSRFGEREVTSSMISKNHAGIDLAANLGTTIYAATSGTVELVSSESGYGNHFKITEGNIATLYAHCKTIYATPGQRVNQGDAIAEVGSTGNSTGPHLHFEIIFEDRYVNPEYVLEF